MQHNFKVLLLLSNEGNEEVGPKMQTNACLQKRKAIVLKDSFTKGRHIGGWVFFF